MGTSRIAGDRTVTLAMPFKALSPTWGKSVGGVSERAGAKAGESNLLALIPSRVVAVEGIPVFRMAALFAGRCRKEGLGRLVIRYSGFLRGIERAGDSGCPKVAQEGNDVGLRHFKRRHRTQARDIVACGSGRVLHSVLRPVHVDPRYASSGNRRWRGASGGIAAG
jgi:hypothetical protein